MQISGDEKRSELDSVVSYRPGEGASEQVMRALRDALSSVDDNPARLDLETLKMLLEIAKRTNSATRGMIFDVAV
tara:strand:+ start:792 stop:1016 length:225 start_codon:yes stop_codon:yes gene_type:complete